MRVGGVVMLVLSLPLAGLGAFMAVIDPRHGSEIVGYPLLALGVLLLVGGVRRLNRGLK